jgi:hypothetical protein
MIPICIYGSPSSEAPTIWATMSKGALLKVKIMAGGGSLGGNPILEPAG